MTKTYKKPTKKDWELWGEIKKNLPDYAKMSDEDMKRYRLYTLLQWMCNFETRSFSELAKEIWITEPTFRDFMKGKYSEKTFKLVENWFLQHIAFLSEQVCHYKDIRDDRE